MLTQQQALMHVRAAYPSQTILPLPADSVLCEDDMYTFTIRYDQQQQTTCFVSPVSGVITEEDTLQ